ncbi:MAG TPA: nucleotidyltransferase domain-containing protein [Thermomicrobiales bacterium]|nr:nucleotidyltransferase domain-containing protein [Thermomicrobiales bacterium]
MIALIAQHQPAIRDLCREFGVLRLDLFGSAATGDFDPERSDIDFLVEYPPDYDFGPWLARYFELKDRLEALLGHPVDLIMSGAPRNPYVIRSIEASRQQLYAA